VKNIAAARSKERLVQDDNVQVGHGVVSVTQAHACLTAPLSDMLANTSL